MRSPLFITGNLATAPEVTLNSDGSRRVRLVIADTDVFKTKDEYKTRYYECSDFLPATKAGNGVYGLIDKGDKVSVLADVRPTSYINKAGETVFKIDLSVERVNIEESASVRNGRKAAKAAETKAAAEAQSGAEAAPVAGTTVPVANYAA